MTDNTAIPVAAGLAIGTAFVILFAFIDTALMEASVGIFTLDGREHFRPDKYEQVNIFVEGLNDVYHASEPIAFSTHFIGFIPVCDAAPSIKIIHVSSNEIVYHYDPFVVSLCSIGDFVDDTVIFADLNEGNTIAFTEGGEYKMIIEQYGEVVEREFVIVRADSGKSVSGDILSDEVDITVDSIDVMYFDHELVIGRRE